MSSYYITHTLALNICSVVQDGRYIRDQHIRYTLVTTNLMRIKRKSASIRRVRNCTTFIVSNFLTKLGLKCRGPLVLFLQEPSVMFPVMDESERDFLRAAVRLTHSSDDEDRYIVHPFQLITVNSEYFTFDNSCFSSPSSPSCGHPGFMYNPRIGRSGEKPCSPRSPATDSGRPNSDDEDKRLSKFLLLHEHLAAKKEVSHIAAMTQLSRTHPFSTKSLDDGFFDSSFHKKEEDTPSEALTSISNLQKIADNFPEEGEDCHHINLDLGNTNISSV